MASPLPPHAKPMRLALACNQCRKRKVRCNAKQPKCSNCEQRGDICEARDPRKSGQITNARRRVAKVSTPPTFGTEARPRQESNAAAPLPSLPLSPSGQSRPHEVPSGTPTRQVISPSSQRPQHRAWTKDHISWLTRAYHQTSGEAADEDPSRQVHVDGDSMDQNSAFSPDVVMTKDGKVKFLGGSCLQCLFVFIDLHLTRHNFSPMASLFNNGMTHSEEVPLSLLSRLPDLPERHVFISYVDLFWKSLWPFYPILDRANIESSFDLIAADHKAHGHGWREHLRTSHIPIYVMIYALTCIGINEQSEGEAKAGEKFLSACYSLQGHLIARPYISSVQALLLVALALREQGRDGQAWQMTGQAVRLAQSLGLHRLGTIWPHMNRLSLDKQESELRERVWWTCFALEKLLQLECGRPSAIDPDYNYLFVGCTMDAENDQTLAYFTAWVSLASIMGQISERLYSQAFSGSGELLSEVSCIDQSLVEWEAALPDQLKPREMQLDHDDKTQLLHTFISQQFHHAQIATFRIALLFPHLSFTAEVNKRRAEISNTSRLLSGANICISAARTIVTNVLQHADAGVRSVLLSGPQMFLATVVLALAILRQPSSRLSPSDVGLLESATEYMSKWWGDWGMPTSFTQIFTLLKERVTFAFHDRAKGGSGLTQAASLGERGGPSGRNVSGKQQSGISSDGGADVPPGQDLGGPDMTANDPFPNFELENLWAMMDSDFLLQY